MTVIFIDVTDSVLMFYKQIITFHKRITAYQSKLKYLSQPTEDLRPLLEVAVLEHCNPLTENEGKSSPAFHSLFLSNFRKRAFLITSLLSPFLELCLADFETNGVRSEGSSSRSPIGSCCSANKTCRFVFPFRQIASACTRSSLKVTSFTEECLAAAGLIL